MRLDDLQREEARDWLVTGQDERLGDWISQFPLTVRHEEPWLLLLEGEWHRHARRYPEAAHCFDLAAQRFVERGDDAGCFAAYGDLLGVAYDRQDVDALDVWAAKAEKYFASGTMLDRAEFLNNQACAALARGNQSQAVVLLRRVLDIPRFGSLHIASIQQFAALNLGIMAMERTDLEEAARHFRKALSLAHKNPLRPTVALGANLYLARIAFFKGDLDAVHRALDVLPETQDLYRRAEMLQLRADTLLVEDRHQEAEPVIEAALTLYDELNVETADVAIALSTLGQVRSRQGQRAVARSLHERALEMTAGWCQYRAAVLLNLAETVDQPETILLEALAEARKADSLFYEAWAGLRLGGPHAQTAHEAMERAGCWLLKRIPALRDVTAERTHVIDSGARPAGTLSIQALGRLDVLLEGAELTRWPRRKIPVLLLMLALHPDGLSREDLAEGLFPDDGPAEAEHQLDNLSSSLRKLLEPELGRKQPSRFLLVANRHYRLAPGTWTADFLEFQTGLDRAEQRRRAGDTEEWREILGQTLLLYRGDLLSDSFYLSWFELERRHYRKRYVTAALQLAESLQTDGRLEAAQEQWERLIEMDPICEEAHAGLIELFERNGRRTLAEAQRQQLRQALQKRGLSET